MPCSSGVPSHRAGFPVPFRHAGRQTGFSCFELGFRHFNARSKPITKASDIQGRKVRVIPTQIYVAFMNAIGANAVPKRPRAS
jgi:TRAP-type C4-dicarboxylate transport system substrate-binding protein